MSSRPETWKTRAVEVVARPAHGGLLRYLAKAARPKLSWVRAIPGRQPAAEDTEGPTVVLITNEGREVVLQRPGTMGQARRSAAGLRRELDAAGAQEFARRHGLSLP